MNLLHEVRFTLGDVILYCLISVAIGIISQAIWVMLNDRLQPSHNPDTPDSESN